MNIFNQKPFFLQISFPIICPKGPIPRVSSPPRRGLGASSTSASCRAAQLLQTTNTQKESQGTHQTPPARLGCQRWLNAEHISDDAVGSFASPWALQAHPWKRSRCLIANTWASRPLPRPVAGCRAEVDGSDASSLLQQLIPAGSPGCPCTGLGNKPQPGFRAQLAAQGTLAGQMKGGLVSRC